MPRVANYDEMRTRTREPTGVEFLFTRWTLSSDLPATSTTAAVRLFNSTTSVYEDGTYTEEIYSEEYWVSGDIVFTCWMADSNRHEVIFGIRKASWIEFTLDGALLTTEASKAATLVNWSDGRNPDPDVAGITVWNMNESGGNYVYYGDTNDVGYATYHARDDKYYITAMECP